MLHVFEDRADAGRQLAERLASYAGQPGVLVLGIPRGGVSVAAEVAAALGVPMDVFVARKLGVPGHEELAMGAVASGGVVVTNDEIVQAFAVSGSQLSRVKAESEREVRRRELQYRGDRPPLDLHGTTVILVDDGIATGSTLRAAVSALRVQGAKRVVVAAPVAAIDSLVRLERVADEVVVLETPARFYAVGAWYREFPKLRDDEVRALLEGAAERLPEGSRAARSRAAASSRAGG
jgi:predicted phosphoribosyltransferase